MDRMERMMNKYPFLSFKFIKMPDGLSGFNHENTIYIDRNSDKKTQTAVLAEEIAHYETTSGDIISNNDLNSKKQEQLARRRAGTSLVTLDGLIEAYQSGATDPDELSEKFEVNLDFIANVLDFYRDMYGLIFLYHGYIFNLSNGINIFKR